MFFLRSQKQSSGEFPILGDDQKYGSLCSIVHWLIEIIYYNITCRCIDLPRGQLNIRMIKKHNVF